MGIEKKKCLKCGITKSITAFHKRTLKTKVIRQSCCKMCSRSISKMDYRNNPIRRSRVRSRANSTIRKNREMIISIKSTPCVDCGGSFPYYVMDLHHTTGSKKNVISNLMTYSVQTLQEELDKCIVLCSNCHRIRTHKNLAGDKN